MGIFNAIFGDDDDRENKRSYVASQCKEGTDPRSEPSIGWGDSDRDYSDEEHHRSWGDAWKHRIETSQPEDIEIKRRNK